MKKSSGKDYDLTGKVLTVEKICFMQIPVDSSFL